METGSTSNQPEVNILQKWWEENDFEAKQFCHLTDDAKLLLKATAYSPERVIAQLHNDAPSSLIKALSEKFQEVEARFKELKDEWDSSEDKIKIIGKISRTKDYLLNANAIGNYAPLHEQVGEWQKHINTLIADNLKAKQALVAHAEALADTDTWKETSLALKELADKWKEIGFIDKDKNDYLLSKLEAAKTKFFERKRQNQELQEKEMLQNLDLKMDLVERAETLAESEEWKQATETFKQLFEEWKGIGRTLLEKNEALWQRFIGAQNRFFERKRAHYDLIKQSQEENYTSKLAIVEEAEKICESTDWVETTNAYVALMDAWKATGRVAQDKADELWDRMSKARDKFFGNKRSFFDAQRVSYEDNLARKKALVNRAEVLKNSFDWQAAKNEFAEMFEEWKKIGAVARAENEKLWEDFTAARRFFFQRKDEDRERRRLAQEKQLENRIEQTRQFLTLLQNELKEEQDNLEEFKVALANIEPGVKAKEMQANLERLIRNAGPNIERKTQKIGNVQQQLDELLQWKQNKIEAATNEKIKAESTVVAETPEVSNDAKTENTDSENIV